MPTADDRKPRKGSAMNLSDGDVAALLGAFRAAAVGTGDDDEVLGVATGELYDPYWVVDESEGGTGDDPAARGFADHGDLGGEV